jgi:hypothetical protein
MTTEFKVKKYTSEDAQAWNNFVSQAKNATFLFDRAFMEYHQDRFTDYSLCVYKDSKLVAVLPANVDGNTVESHRGLTYGGLVLAKKLKFNDVLGAFKAALAFLSSEGIVSLRLKLIPKIYHALPADEIDYLLFITKASQTRVDMSSSIDLKNPLKIQSNRLEGVKKAQKHGLRIEEDGNFNLFWNEILEPNLRDQHDANPVHSSKEIESLAASFPKHIKQFNVFKEDTLVAGATIFETEHLAHVQYISANADKQQLGSLDFLFEYLITNRYSAKRYFDFGMSNENQGLNLNEGLLYWKECFGARSIAHQFYTIETKNYALLDTVFI